MSTQVSDDLLPRRYQEEVFSRAQKGNIIAALGTGSGKTLISLLLIKSIFAQQASDGKVIIFLVPKVTLVEQQGNYLAKHTPLRIIKLHGALDISLTDRQGWRKRFAEHDVFVMTAQIFLNLLTHSLWSIDKVSLMVFDECHHARKNHPYNGIMREYFQLNPPSQRPKIFGMTASPIWNLKDAVGSLAMLEANMDAKVVGVRAQVDELAEHSPKPVEIIKEYPHPPEECDYPSYPSPSLWSCLCVFESALWSELEIPWQGIEMRYHATLSNIGPYPASLFLLVEMQQHLSRTLQEYKEKIRVMDNTLDCDIASGLSLHRSLPSAFWVIRDILMDFENFFSDGSIANDIPILVDLEWCTPKIRTLVDILLAHYSPTFQGIVFVEQRQVAAVLAKILPAIPQLKGVIRCASLVGQGVGLEGIPKTTGNNQGIVVEQFRNGDINLLIATSVAEEGLDFPACDLVVRFDPLLHMVGYVQSRGRARNKASTFIIMIEKDDIVHLSRYQSLKEGEPEMNRAYQSRHLSHGDEADGDDDDEEINPADLLERERYVVPSTGAILNYDNSINLLQYLCDLIPRDSFTPQHIPKFVGDFQSTVQLPTSIPLSAENRTFTGPLRRSKREAKRAAAFVAAKHLHQLSVFDDYLLPATSAKGKITEDADGRAVGDISGVPSMMEVSTIDPWTIGPKLWIHMVYIGSRPVAGLVTGTLLPPVKLVCNASWVRLKHGKLMTFSDDEDEGKKVKVMREFTKLGIWYRISGRPLTLFPSLFLVPLTIDHQADFGAMERLIENPYGIDDWSSIGEKDYDRVIIMNRNEFGRPRLLRRIRFDLTPISKPIPGSREDAFCTYYDYFMMKWTRKKWAAQVPRDGPLLEAILLPRSSDGIYSLNPPIDNSNLLRTAPNGILLPRDCCRWVPMSYDIHRAYEILPALCHRVTDIYRVRRAKYELGLPPIIDDALVEAFTLPSASAGYNNQRLETLGDAVLELCTTVHLYNKYPHRHEGQLTILRQQAISNRYLLARAKEIELEKFLISEGQIVNTWRYVEPVERCLEAVANRTASRCFPRRSLQDCMEATLGASFVTGGIQMALHAGAALDLAFGGTMPWSVRYSRKPEASPVSKLFTSLEHALGYTFHQSELLLEAVTHPSFVPSLGGSSYQRLEFLGDALLNLVVINYLYDKFPAATSHKLSLPRAKAICAPALASLAIRRLGLHKIMLINCVDLTEEIERYAPLLQTTSGEEIIKRGWRYDPPKALSDVFESVMGAVLVDSGYNYERAAAIVEYVMQDVLVALSPSVSRDPVSELIEWAAGSKCTAVTFGKGHRLHDGIQVDGMTVLVHGTVVVGPVVASSLSVAKFLAAERALMILSDATSEKALTRFCICGQATEINVAEDVGEAVPQGETLDTIKEAVFDDPLESQDLEEVC